MTGPSLNAVHTPWPAQHFAASRTRAPYAVCQPAWPPAPPTPAHVSSPAALALFAAILLDTVTEILEVLVSGRLRGVPGGESRFRLLVIIREAAGRKSKEESPVRRGPGKGGRLGKATLGLNGLYCQDWEAWGGPVFQGLVIAVAAAGNRRPALGSVSHWLVTLVKLSSARLGFFICKRWGVIGGWQIGVSSLRIEIGLLGT